MGSFLTLDNLTTKISYLHEAPSNHLYAVVDMGSNGIRFSISDLSFPQSRLLTCVYRERAGISLYDALQESTSDSKQFQFSRQTISQVTQTVKRFKIICDRHGIPNENITVFSTDAMRNAMSHAEMFQAIQEATGLTVDILSPSIESLFGAMGARSGLSQVDGLIMDLGGGSVQMTYLNTSLAQNYDILAEEAAISMPFGAARLTKALKSKEITEAAETKLRASMKITFESLVQRFSQLRAQVDSNDGVTIYLCGGGFRGYGSMLMHTDPIQPYPIPAIGGYSVSGQRFSSWREMLREINREENKIYGISKRRREQFPAIVLVVQALVEAIPKIKSVTFCSGGNREGFLFMKLPPTIRESDPFSFFPSPLQNQDPVIYSSIANILMAALPPDHPAILSPTILNHITRNIWVHQGKLGNASRVLHDCLCGNITGLPDLPHKICAVFALILTARWGLDLAPADAKLMHNLQALVGVEIAWWCQYIGIASCFLADIFPGFPNSGEILGDLLQWEATLSKSLGKKGKKQGVKLRISLMKDLSLVHVRSMEELEKTWKKVGSGLNLGWRVETKISLR